ncbi:hypothetical protein Spb1_39760 [Planctopirus ephydatiae]|uniref:DUF1802 family protein n=1 Tax=Planctopirus ephydatiae TaxID=2528019 RepID=A0A518GTV6_9PLAN|nr:DUF1802 family protein [Planctopirus ephydatiae]QDV32028.1 hypothetical protein Spb1_39760 [Planctopirus ephydatiae]
MTLNPVDEVEPFAFKEWAAICAALVAGRQSIILRKGGIHEGPAGFQPEHREFWLLPTQFHQEAGQLTEEGWPFLEAASIWKPFPGEIVLPAKAQVQECRRLTTWEEVAALQGEHIWGEVTLRNRFEYRSPGLTYLRVTITSVQPPIRLPIWPELEGCKSWVRLPDIMRGR